MEASQGKPHLDETCPLQHQSPCMLSSGQPNLPPPHLGQINHNVQGQTEAFGSPGIWIWHHRKWNQALGSWWVNEELPFEPATSSQAALLICTGQDEHLGASLPVHSCISYQGFPLASPVSHWVPVNLECYTFHNKTVISPLYLTAV